MEVHPAAIRPSMGLALLATLALAQGVFGALRAFGWIQVGIDLWGRGVLMFPLMGGVAMARGGLIAGIATLYVLFAFGALSRKAWTWWVGLVAAVMNVLLALPILMEGESVLQPLLWIFVPTLLLIYLFTPAGRESLK